MSTPSELRWRHTAASTATADGDANANAAAAAASAPARIQPSASSSPREELPSSCASPSVSASATAAASAATAAAPSARRPSCFFRMRRYLCFVPLFLSLLLLLWAVVATLTHNYSHPRVWIDRALHYARGGVGDSASEFEYPSNQLQSCAMSYFHLSHREVEVTRLSPVSQAMVEGRIGDRWTNVSALLLAQAQAQQLDSDSNAGAAATERSEPTPTRKAHPSSEDVDEEEEALIAADEAEAEEAAAAAAAAAAQASAISSSSPSARQQQSEFLMLRSLALSALPSEAVEAALDAAAAAAAESDAASSSSPSSRRTRPSRYKLWQYVETTGGAARGGERYRRELHPLSKEAVKARRSSSAAAASKDSASSVPEWNRNSHGNGHRIPLLFLPGNSGSYHQFRSLASRLNLVWGDERDNRVKTDPASYDKQRYEQGIPDRNDYYSLDFGEESSALSGSLVWTQAWFANEALGFILESYPASTRVILVAHSMGGIVARLMPALTNHPRLVTTSGLESIHSTRVALILTLGTPHKSPLGSLVADSWMARAYHLVNDRIVPEVLRGNQNFTDPLGHLAAFVDRSQGLHYLFAAHSKSLRALEASSASAAGLSSSAASFAEQESRLPRPPILISLAGGERDIQVETALTDLGGIYAEDKGGDEGVQYTLSISAHSVHYGVSPGESGGVAASVEVQQLIHSTTEGGAIASVDHQCLAWCRQLVEVAAYSVRDMTLQLLAKAPEQKRTFRDSYRTQKQIWIAPAVGTMRHIAAASAAATMTAAATAAPVASSVVSAASAPSQSQWPLYAESFSSGNGTVVLSIPTSAAKAGLLFLWVGLMKEVRLCDASTGTAGGGAVKPRCVDLGPRVQLLSPSSHPSLASLSTEQRVAKRLAIGSTYMLHIAENDLPASGGDSGGGGGEAQAQGFTLRLVQHEATRTMFASVRPLRARNSNNAARKKPLRQIGFGFALAQGLESLPLQSDNTAVLPNRPGIYRWIHPLAGGLDSHWGLRVEPGGNLENEYALPRMVVLFGVSDAQGGAEGSSIKLPPNSFTDQLMVFHTAAAAPSSATSSSRSRERQRLVHFYRSGLERQAIGLFVRIPELDGLEGVQGVEGAEDAATPPLKLHLSPHRFISLLHSLFLQLSLLPSMALGVALLCFAAQHETLRRRGSFPRLYELFVLPLPSSFSSSSSRVAWVVLLSIPFLVLLAFFLLWHGSLTGSGILSNAVLRALVDQVRSDSTKSSLPLSAEQIISTTWATQARTSGHAALWTGWTLAGGSMEGRITLAFLGIILCSAAIAALILAESLVYLCLQLGGKIVRFLWGRCVSGPFAKFAASASTPQARYILSWFRRATTFLWVVSFLVLIAFCLALAFVALDRLAGISMPLDILDFVASQSLAWFTTILNVFRVMDGHWVWSVHGLPLLVKVTTIPVGIDPAPLVVALAILAACVHCITFPPNIISSSAAASPTVSVTRNELSRRNLANYKCSVVLMMILLAGVFVGPQLGASFRMTSTAAVGANQPSSSSSSSPPLLFQPLAATKQYENLLVGVGGSSATGDGDASVSGVYLPPFLLRSSLFLSEAQSPHALVALVWVVLLALCGMSLPSEPPLLQGMLMALYGGALIFVPGGPTAFHELHGLGAMLCLCMLPHALASILLLLNVTIDRIQGTEGRYQALFEREQRARWEQRQMQEQQQTKQPTQQPAAASSQHRSVNSSTSTSSSKRHHN